MGRYEFTTATPQDPRAAEAMRSAKAAWSAVQDVLQAALGGDSYHSYVSRIQVAQADDECVVLVTSTGVARDWMKKRAEGVLADAWAEADPMARRVEIKSKADLEDEDAAQTSGSVTSASVMRGQGVRVRQASAGGFDGGDSGGPNVTEVELGAMVDKRYTFDTFVVGESNRMAHKVALEAAEWPETLPGFNPVFFYGPHGVGKTHLIMAIAHRAQELRPDRRVVYLRADEFLETFVSAIRNDNTFAFKERVRNADMLIVDDLHHIAGKPKSEEEFCITLRHLVDEGRQVVLSADKKPDAIEQFSDRLRSQLLGGLVWNIKEPDLDLRRRILERKAEIVRQTRPNFDVPKEVLDFLAARIVTPGRILEGALNKLVVQTIIANRPVTMEAAHEVVRDMELAAPRRVSIEEIQKTVCGYYDVSLPDLLGPCRARCYARPRQIAMYLAKTLTPRSYPDIGHRFGDRDHTTIMHGYKKIHSLIESDAQIAHDVEQLIQMLRSGQTREAA